MPDIMVYKHRKAQLALFRSVSRERIDWARTQPCLTKPTQPICRGLWAKKQQTPLYGASAETFRLTFVYYSRIHPFLQIRLLR